MHSINSASNLASTYNNEDKHITNGLDINGEILFVQQ